MVLTHSSVVDHPNIEQKLNEGPTEKKPFASAKYRHKTTIQYTPEKKCRSM